MLNKDTIKHHIPFNGLDDEYLDEALKHISVESFRKGEMIFKRGRAVAKRYFLLSGHVDLIDSSYYVESLTEDKDRAKSTLNPDSPTRCSAIVKSSKATVYSIETAALDRIVAWSQSAAAAPQSSFNGETSGEFSVEEINEKTGDWMSSLLQSPLFSRIPLTQVQELFLRFEDVTYKKDEMVIKEGEKGDYFYVVASGRARVVNRLGSVDLELKPGDYFGEEALLGETLRNASVYMMGSGILKRLNSADFTALLKSPVLRYVENRILEKLDKPYKLIDVKMPMEYRVNHVPGSINVPLSRLRSTLSELGGNSIYVVPDDAGSRADIAAHLLCQAGFEAMILKSPESVQ
ncbi:cyclic nucleotide-binding domain-containing protein [Teredinibacter sp. KSP-S5-2]|uniref:cyclic nucleotide-binding domain-containing protein n=1 Tax=Teredinibacter sp. KSP-S5-2 TaxID=3034506 RepID=UPI002934DBC1|nr:cyclic nucleotide-binding domain-containing protein [Teredinibacter sp. KSP-S5-2]WNO07999.1 cyclic nucleotide-binding domain-containing protein [Teredinibacter sp. KSP-S5-2]